MSNQLLVFLLPRPYYWLMEKLKQYACGIFILVFAGSAFIVWYAVFWIEGSYGTLVLEVMDVGQGDAIFVEAAGIQILIDGGPNDAVLTKLGDAMPFWDRSLDLVILTHPDKDHISGLLDVLERYRVDMILWSGVQHSTAEYQEWLRLVEEEGAEIHLARAGQRLELGSSGAVFDILAPFTDGKGEFFGSLNDTSVVGLLRFWNVSALFMGDAAKMTEYRLLFESPEMLDANILKAGHHGSKTSSSEAFLKIVSPQYAAISAGKKNRYGHPHPEVIDILRNAGVKILRTDIQGTIRFVTDGETWREF